MATTNKVFIGINDKVVELKGDELKEFENDREKTRNRNQQLKKEQEAQKELKISAYKKLGLTDEEIQAII